MIRTAKKHLADVPTPMAGLALGIASLGWCWENIADLHGMGQWSAALIASTLLVILSAKFLSHRHLLRQDLAHPVTGSVVPTYAMALMVVSHSLRQFYPRAGDTLWLIAVILHALFLASFIYHRSQAFELHHMVPSWFVPPVGIIVADVTYGGNPLLLPIAQGALLFGMLAYALLLPLMLYRLMFSQPVADAAKPTLAILAAPASLSLAGYLTVSAHPSPVVVALLFGIAVLMTVSIYLALIHLLRLPFSPGFAALTFPMVIGATALFKLAGWMQSSVMTQVYSVQIRGLAIMELWVATGVVGYVTVRYVMYYQPQPRIMSNA